MSTLSIPLISSSVTFLCRAGAVQSLLVLVRHSSSKRVHPI